jgi:hypothetical protein
MIMDIWSATSASSIWASDPLAEIRAIVVRIILPIMVAFFPARAFIYTWMKINTLRSSGFSPAAASSMLAVLGVVAFYMIYFTIHVGHNVESVAFAFFYSMLLALPAVLFLTPFFYYVFGRWRAPRGTRL